MHRETNLREIIRHYALKISENIKVETVILTGSRSRRDHRRNSDIDLIIVSSNFKRKPLEERLQFLHRHWDYDKYGIPLEAFGYTPAEMNTLKKTSLYVKDALRFGEKISLPFVAR